MRRHTNYCKTGLKGASTSVSSEKSLQSSGDTFSGRALMMCFPVCFWALRTSACMCVSLSAGLRCRVASRYAILETPLRSGSERGTRGKNVCVGGWGGACSGALRPRRVSPAVFARQTCVGLDVRDAPTFRDDSSVTVQLVFLWVINTQWFKKEPLWPGLVGSRGRYPIATSRPTNLFIQAEGRFQDLNCHLSTGCHIRYTHLRQGTFALFKVRERASERNPRVRAGMSQRVHFGQAKVSCLSAAIAFWTLVSTSTLLRAPDM